MGNQLEILEAEALKLTAGERAACARLLLATPDEDTATEKACARAAPSITFAANRSC
ncbi:MAG: hypothetical protein AW11_04083 [Candidatus Accumulibacter regalis]|jgi:hypothetical protein|uniref:Uncharacterized protein n=1 Tax=Accumulibacter regalis TaxID=522306 RepID=A0A011Q3A6_ACCRE|nr:MAG: hypothetical protein AW11_04083 [Candidatus Accumulibacter regalis]